MVISRDADNGFLALITFSAEDTDTDTDTGNLHTHACLLARVQVRFSHGQPDFFKYLPERQGS